MIKQVMTKQVMINEKYFSQFSIRTYQKLAEGKNINEKKTIINIIIENDICGLMYLYYFKLFQKFLKNLDLTLLSTKQYKDVLHILCRITHRYRYIWNEFQKTTKITFLDTLKKQEPFKNKLAELQSQKINVSKNTLQKLVEQYFDLVNLQNDYQFNKKKEIFIRELLRTKDENDCFKQFTINWLKMSTQTNIISKYAESFLCCRIFYTIKDQVESSESQIQQFKNYYWPINNNSLVHHLKKTVVGFLNNRGGIIYMGLIQEKVKCIRVDGMELKLYQKVHQNVHQKMELIKFIQNSVLRQVKPAIQQSQACIKYKQIYDSHNTLEEQYYFNKFVSADFIPIVNKDLLLNQADLYVTRIKVRPGDFTTLYYLLGQKKPITPQYYFREDKSVRKRNIQEAKEEIYRRLSKTEPDQATYKPYHESCRCDLQPFNFQRTNQPSNQKETNLN